MKLGEVLQKTIQFFKAKNFPTPRLDAELIIAHALDMERIQLYVKYDQPLVEEEVVACREVVKRRSQGEPVAYICGTKEFFGLSFKVTKDVLIPRPETEHLVELALEWANKKLKVDANLNIIDLGTGSGCIAIALAKRLSKSRIIAFEKSEKALEIANQNAAANKVEDQIEFKLADCFLAEKDPQLSALFGGEYKASIIVGNPPYIAHEDHLVQDSVKKFEPHGALFSEENGLKHIKDWFDTFSKLLDRPCLFAFEVGVGQAQIVSEYFQQSKIFHQVTIIKDLSGIQRIVAGVCNG